VLKILSMHGDVVLLLDHRQDIMDAMVQSGKFEGDFRGFTSKKLYAFAHFKVTVCRKGI
jgi:hypothetical protein